VDSRSSSQLDNVFESIRVNNETVVIFTSGIQVKKPFTEPGEPLIKEVGFLGRRHGKASTKQSIQNAHVCPCMSVRKTIESNATAVQQLPRGDQGKGAGVTVYQPDGVLAHTCGLSGVSTVVSAWVESWRTAITQPALNVLIFII